MLNSVIGPFYSWEMCSDRHLYWQKHGMVLGEYLFQKNLLVKLYKEDKITLREMLYRWKRDAKPHKEDFDNVIMPLVKRALMR